MERPKSFDRTPLVIENIENVINRSIEKEIPLWATQLHEAPFPNEIKLSF